MTARDLLTRIFVGLIFIGLPASVYGLTLERPTHASAHRPVIRETPRQVFPPRPTSIPTPTPTQAAELTRTQFTAVERRLSRIVYRQNPGAALAELAHLMDTNAGVLRSCHALAHSTGHAAYARYHDFAAAVRFGDDICGSGYLHGVIEARFTGVRDIYAELQTICNAYIAINQAGKCFHGVGHGLMRFTNNDVPTALNMCGSYGLDVFKVRCAEGVFMENFGTDLQAHFSRYLRATDPMYPCPEQPEFYKGACYYYAPLYYLNLHDGRYLDALRMCDSAEAGYVQTCVTGTGSRIMKQNIRRPRWVERLCRQAGASKAESCIDGMVSYYLVNFNSYRRGQELCALMDPIDKPACNNALSKRQAIFPA